MPLSVMDGLPWWVSLLCQGNFKPLCSFLGQQKETFLPLVNHNLSLLSWCKPDVQSLDSGHGATFDVNKHQFHRCNKSLYLIFKEKKGKKLSDWQGRTGLRYVEQFYQVWDEYFSMTPEKGQLINYSRCYMLGTKRTKGRVQ